MPLLPSRRLLLLICVAAPAFLLGVAAAAVVNGLLLVAVAVDAVRVSRYGVPRVRRRGPSALALGATGEVVLEAEVGGPVRGPVRVRVTDDVPAALRRDGADDWELELMPGTPGAVRYGVVALERGVTALGDIHLRVLGPLGLVWRCLREPRTDRVQVQPGMSEVRRHRHLTQRHRLRDAGLRSVRERGEGTSFESLREYRRGDDPRWIDWKATARRVSVTVRQFEAERSQNVMLVVDAGRLMAERVGGRERLDLALSASLLLADVARRQGDRVGIMVFADRVQQFLPPSRAPIARFADAFARVETRPVEPDYPGAFAYLARSLRRRSLLVLFTDVIDARASAALLAHLDAASRRHLPLVVTLRNTGVEEAAVGAADAEPGVYRRAAAEELIQARARALAGMQRAGVLVVDARPGDATPSLINRYLEVKRRGLL